MKKNKIAFTIVELIVVITILAILGAIAFTSLQGYQKTARNSRRISDINNIKTSLALFMVRSGYYPMPDNGKEMSYSGELLRTQGTVGNNVSTNLSKNLTKKPTDPLLDTEYVYSVTNIQKEYQVMSLYEGDFFTTNTLINNLYASDTFTTKVEGDYNEIFVKSKHYMVPTPSIINSDILPVDLIEQPGTITSAVITNGKNIPQLGTPLVQSHTGGLDIKLSVYTGSITADIDDSVKKHITEIIQQAYTGSTLSNEGIYGKILSITGSVDLIEIFDYIVLNNNYSGSSSNDNTPNISTPVTSCDGTISGETKDFYDTSGVEVGLSCDTHKRNFICDNTIWKDGADIADTTIYSYTSCSVAGDITAPIGGDFLVPLTSTSTSVSLTIICPTDAAGSNPIEMYISGTGLSSGGNTWEPCSSSKNIELTSLDGSKNISIKWKDSIGNETSNLNKSVTLSIVCNLPWGGTISNSQNVTAYVSSSVVCGSSCTSQTRTCSNGILSGSYTNSSCNVLSCPTSGPYSYSARGSCNVSCGGGTQYRTESCNYDSCYSSQATSTSCNTQACPTSGPYSYGSRGSCSVSCGGGIQYRPQYCNYDSCYSAQATSQSCNTGSCCVGNVGASCTFTGNHHVAPQPFTFCGVGGYYCAVSPQLGLAYCSFSSGADRLACRYPGTIQCNGSCTGFQY